MEITHLPVKIEDKDTMDNFFQIMVREGQYTQEDYSGFTADVILYGQATLFKSLMGAINKSDILDLKCKLAPINGENNRN